MSENKFLIAGCSGPNGLQLQFLRPVPQLLSHADALLLAAWLVAMVGDDEAWEAARKDVES